MTEETNHKTYKLGLALSGGGAKGFAHVGVFKLLEECELMPNVIVETSVGALMGALFADGYSADICSGPTHWKIVKCAMC